MWGGVWAACEGMGGLTLARGATRLLSCAILALLGIMSDGAWRQRLVSGDERLCEQVVIDGVADIHCDGGARAHGKGESAHTHESEGEAEEGRARAQRQQGQAGARAEDLA